MNAILVSVDYTDLLAITLPFNRRHFDRVVVVTSPGDAPNVLPVCLANDAHMHVTGAFYEAGGRGVGMVFMKWKALEEGLDVLRGWGPGWLCVMDADVVWPRTLPADLESTLIPGRLYTPLRRMMADVTGLTRDTVPPESEWGGFPLHRNVAEWAGYSHIFHTSDPVLPRPPWYDTRWLHAGGADSFFQARWPAPRKVRPPWECLHLGEPGVNWMGRSSILVDGTLPDGSSERRTRLLSAIRARQHGPNRFDHEKSPSQPPPEPV
jgi:hypothetical protein